MGDSKKIEEKQKLEKCKLFSICEIRPYLYISGYCTLTAQKLRQNKITHCVDATHIPNTLAIPNLEYLIVPINDTETSRINQFFEPVAEFVQQAKNLGGKCLIYCAAGVSRAATLSMISLVIIEGISLREAYIEVLRSRPLIAPNLGFWRQMIEYEAKRNYDGKTTVELIRGMRKPIPSVYLYKSSILNSTNIPEN